MLNPFPTLLIYGIFAPLLIRVAVGTVLLYLSVEHLRGRKEIAHALRPMTGGFSSVAPLLLVVCEVIAGVLLVVGAWTQFAAILAIVLSLKALLTRRSLHALRPFPAIAYVLLIVMSLSLLISGAGAFAFDLPL